MGKKQNVPAENEAQGGEKKGKTLNTVVNVILVIAILFGIFCAFNAFQAHQGNGVPSIFGLKFAAIQSDSMEPTFNKGDLIVDIAVKDPSKLKMSSTPEAKDGDVITFWTTINGEVVLNTHRIVDVKDNGNYLSFVTRGDNPNIERNDSMEVHQGKIEGRYLFAIPKLGYVIDFLGTSKGFLIVVVVPVAILFIVEIVQFFRSLFAFQAEKIRLQMAAQLEMMKNQENGTKGTDGGEPGKDNFSDDPPADGDSPEKK